MPRRKIKAANPTPVGAIKELLKLVPEVEQGIDKTWHDLISIIKKKPLDEWKLVLVMIELQYQIHLFEEKTNERYGCLREISEEQLIASGQKDLMPIKKLYENDYTPSSFFYEYLKSKYAKNIKRLLSKEVAIKISAIGAAIKDLDQNAIIKHKQDLFAHDDQQQAQVVSVWSLQLGCFITSFFTNVFGISGDVEQNQENHHISHLLLEILLAHTDLKDRIEQKQIDRDNIIKKVGEFLPSLRTAIIAPQKRYAAIYHLEKYNNEWVTWKKLIEPVATASFKSDKLKKLQQEVVNYFKQYRYQPAVSRLLDIYNLLRHSGISYKALPNAFKKIINVVERNHPRLIQELTIDMPTLKKCVEEKLGKVSYSKNLNDIDYFNGCLQEKEVINILFRFIRNLCAYVVNHFFIEPNHDRHGVVRELLAKANEILLWRREQHPIDRLLELYSFAHGLDVGRGKVHEFISQLGDRVFGNLKPQYEHKPKLFKKSFEYKAISEKPWEKFNCTSSDLEKSRNDPRVYQAVVEHISNIDERSTILRKLLNFLADIFYKATNQVPQPLAKAVTKVGIFKKKFNIAEIGNLEKFENVQPPAAANGVNNELPADESRRIPSCSEVANELKKRQRPG